MTNYTALIDELTDFTFKVVVNLCRIADRYEQSRDATMCKFLNALIGASTVGSYKKMGLPPEVDKQQAKLTLEALNVCTNGKSNCRDCPAEGSDLCDDGESITLPKWLVEDTIKRLKELTANEKPVSD